MLLTNLPVETLADAKRILRFYCRRWECEEGVQFLKAERLSDYAQVLPDEVDFMLYRLLTGLTHILNACFYVRRDLL